MFRQRIAKLQKLLDFELRKLEFQQQIVQKLRVRQSEFELERDSLQRQRDSVLESAAEQLELRMTTLAYADRLSGQMTIIQQQLRELFVHLEQNLATLKTQHGKVKSLEKLVDRVREEFWQDIDRKAMIEADERYLQQQFILDRNS